MRRSGGVAPDTLILLGSFMSFFGGSQAISGADGLAEQFPGIWENVVLPSMHIGILPK